MTSERSASKTTVRTLLTLTCQFSKRVCCVLWPIQNQHWYLDEILSKYSDICLCKRLSRSLERLGKMLTGQ